MVHKSNNPLRAKECINLGELRKSIVKARKKYSNRVNMVGSS